MTIRTMGPSDRDRAAEIWLEGNLQAHAFIDPCYWKSHFEEVKAQLLQAEAYVCEGETGVEGFIGLEGDWVAGIFVWRPAQGRGVGKALLEQAKEKRSRLSLRVYQDNKRAVAFYQREGFHIRRESADGDTGALEYVMEWSNRQTAF